MSKHSLELIDSTYTQRLSALEDILGYNFKDRHLLQTALTAPSARGNSSNIQQDNQRLEFLGDAVLGLLYAQKLYHEHSYEDEGTLTIRRSQLVSGKALAQLAHKIGLATFMRVGKCEKQGGRMRAALLADAIEAIFGAAWCDGGLRAAETIHHKLAPLIEYDEFNPWHDNPKGHLQVLCQSKAWQNSPRYDLVATSGPDHQPRFTVRVTVEDHTAHGSGSSKRNAEAAAATAMLQLLHKAN